MSRNIIIKIREEEDRKVIFKLPNAEIDISLDLYSIKHGEFALSYNIRDLKNMIDRNKEEKKDREREHYREVIQSES